MKDQGIKRIRKFSSLSSTAKDFIDDGLLFSLLTPDGKEDDSAAVEAVIQKSLSKTALNLEDTALLLRVRKPELQEKILEAANRLKRNIYGNRIVLFAPLYLGNRCINDCAYCGFRKSNREAIRRTLTPSLIRKQVETLEDHGHKRLILVFGEHPRYTPEFIADTVRLVYSVKKGMGSIRRVNINAAPLDHEGYRTVKQAGIGTYQVFQETYHHDTYRKVHPENTAKGDYLYRLDALSRAFESGCDDVGIGVLVGLADWRFDVLGLVAHALFLQDRYGVGPHTISFPRLRPAQGITMDPFRKVSDEDFIRMVAILRLSVYYTGMILTAREEPGVRDRLFDFGVSQIDAGSRIELGGYTEIGDAQQVIQREQFQLGDMRSLDEVIRQLVKQGLIPSFCTACYRLGRTGEHFMELAIPGFIERFCSPNALLTFQEYLTDYASPETRVEGEKLVNRELAKISDEKRRELVRKRLEQIRTTEDRDLYF